MKITNLLLILSIIAVIIVSINILTVFYKISEFKKEFTGLASGNGHINITINNIVSINLTRAIINWSNGTINSGENNATLFTNMDNPGTVIRGTWQGDNAKAIIVENTGTLNCSLYFVSDKNAHDLFSSSSSSNEEYKFNVTNKEPGSCSSKLNLGQWYDVNKTEPGTEICKEMNFLRDKNEIYIDILLTVPFDTTNVGNQSSILTINAYAS